MPAPYHANLELILVDWIGAHRDGDLERLAELLHEDVEQRWIDGKVYCEVFTVRGGRIAAIRDFVERADALAAAGLDPRAASSR